MINYFIIPGIVTEQKSFTMNDITLIVLDYFKTPAHLVFSKKRYKEIVYVRHILIYLLWVYGKKSLKNWSLKRIGTFLGDRDHTSIIHAKQAILTQLSLKQDNKYKNDVMELRKKLQAQRIIVKENC